MRRHETSIDWSLLSRQACRDATVRLGDLPDLEDLVQDALVLLLQRREGVEKARAWVRGAVWRHLANRERSGHACRPRPFHPDWAGVEDPNLQVELRVALVSAQRHLNPCERRLLELLAAGLSHREIARRLGIGWKSVGTRVQRLRAKLRLLLG